jgi:hypothetical protein
MEKRVILAKFENIFVAMRALEEIGFPTAVRNRLRALRKELDKLLGDVAELRTQVKSKGQRHE